jgi:transposase
VSWLAGPPTQSVAPIRSTSSSGPPTPWTSNVAGLGTTPPDDATTTPPPGKIQPSVGTARTLRRTRWALWKNPDHLNERQHDQLAWIAKTDPRLWRAYLLKEGVRYVFTVKGDTAKTALDRWISWARRSRIPAFIELQRRLVKHRAAINATLDSGLSNALVESTNTKIRLLTRIAYGFHSPEPLIALAMLALGGHAPHLPGRT